MSQDHEGKCPLVDGSAQTLRIHNKHPERIAYTIPFAEPMSGCASSLYPNKGFSVTGGGEALPICTWGVPLSPEPEFLKLPPSSGGAFLPVP